MKKDRLWEYVRAEGEKQNPTGRRGRTGRPYRICRRFCLFFAIVSLIAALAALLSLSAQIAERTEDIADFAASNVSGFTDSLGGGTGATPADNAALDASYLRGLQNNQPQLLGMTALLFVSALLVFLRRHTAGAVCSLLSLLILIPIYKSVSSTFVNPIAGAPSPLPMFLLFDVLPLCLMAAGAVITACIVRGENRALSRRYKDAEAEICRLHPDALWAKDDALWDGFVEEYIKGDPRRDGPPDHRLKKSQRDALRKRKN